MLTRRNSGCSTPRALETKARFCLWTQALNGEHSFLEQGAAGVGGETWEGGSTRQRENCRLSWKRDQTGNHSHLKDRAFGQDPNRQSCHISDL